jgi:PAS domain S-box-containing protein
LRSTRAVGWSIHPRERRVNDVHPQFFEASVTIALAISLALYTIGYGQPGRAKRLFLLLIASIIVWSGGVALSRVFAEDRLTHLAVRVSFVGIFVLPPVWYALSVQLTRPADERFGRRQTIFLSIPSLLAFAAMVTNPWHHLYMRVPEAIIDTSPTNWAGPLFWAWTSWAYLLVLGGSARYVGWSWRLVSNDARWRGALVFLASMLPLSGNLAHLMNLTPPGHDSTPLMLGVASVFLFVADWRFRLLNTLPVARRDVIEQLHDGVVIADAHGVILDMNPAAERMIDAPLAELGGQPIFHVVARQAIDRFDFDAEAFNRLVVDMCTSARGFESYVENFAGQHFEIRGGAVTDLVGNTSGLYFILREVTERRRFEQVQRESRRAQTIASLAAGITHEVNNPLAYVRANVGHVLDEIEHLTVEGKDVDEVRTVLSEALEGIDRIGKIVERVRKFTQTRGGLRESIPIPTLFDEIRRMHARTAPPKIALEVEVEPDVGPVLGAREGLLEAILNLIDNAAQALGEQGGRIRLRARRARHAVRIEVEDDGPGVPDELRDRIFEPFFTTGTAEVGTGLGLAISAKLVADFGGRLGYDAVETGGARFTIELPEVPIDRETDLSRRGSAGR